MKKIKLLFLMCIVLVISGCNKPKSYTRYTNVEWYVIPNEDTPLIYVSSGSLEWTIYPYQFKMILSEKYYSYSNCFYVGIDDYILVMYKYHLNT